MAFAAASLSLVGTTRAVVYTESPDAGDLPASAAVVSTTAGSTVYTAINGTLTLTNGLSEADMFEIYIGNPAAFSASTTGFIAGTNNFDSQLMLFDSTGKGVIANDDAASGGEQSALTAGSLSGKTAGVYFLLITGSGRYASSAGGLIFPNYTDGTTDPTAIVGPTGPGGATAITGYTGNSNEGGKYSIALTGLQAVPEPSTVAFAFASISGLALVLRSRRSVR